MSGKNDASKFTDNEKSIAIFHDWYKQMIFISASEITTILIAVLGIAVFFALFRMKFKWEENEQRYKELKFKEQKTDAA